MPALSNCRHEAFAQHCAEGMSGVQAFRTAVSSKGTVASGIQAASRLLARVNVRSRVEELRKQANDILRDRLGVTKETLLRYHCEILETPVGDIDHTHRLAQESVDTDGGRRVRMPSKLDAAKQLAAMAGWNAPQEQRTTVAGLDELLASICRPGLPRVESGS